MYKAFASTASSLYILMGLVVFFRYETLIFAVVLKLGEDSQINAVIDILKDMKTDGVAGELLVSLLKVFFVLYLIQILKTK